MTSPDGPPSALPAPVAVRSAVADLALVMTFAGFVAVCSVLPAVPTGTAVPVTLQTFAVMLTGLVLGPRRAALAVAAYLGVGLAGLPVFAKGGAGPAVLAGPSAGYLASFLVAAPLAGALGRAAERVRPARRTMVLFLAATTASLLVMHPLGVAVMAWQLGLPADAAMAAGAVYLPGDLLKNALAAVVAAAVLRAYPDLR